MHKIIVSIIALLAMTQTAIAQFNTHISHRLISGKSVQTVKAGNFIEPVVYEITELNRVYDFYINYPVNTTVKTLGLKLDCDTLPSSKAECTISGRIPANTPGDEYEMSFTAAGNYAHEYLQITTGINVTPLNEQVEHVSGSLDQTVTASDEIEPIVFGYTELLKANLSGVPEGISAKIDDESAIITISGATGQDHPDGDFNYRLAAYITEKDSIVFNGTISVKHKKFTTTLVAIENETQDVVAGDAIKPIVFRYAHMQNATVDGILDGFEVNQDKEKDLVIITGAVPQDIGDHVLTITVTAQGNDNNAEAKASVNISANPDYSSSSVSSSSEVSPSSSSVASSSSAAESSSSEADGSSSSELTTAIYVVQNVFNVSFVNNELSVTLASVPSANLLIFDMMGHLLETLDVGASTTINLGHLPRGTLLLRIYGQGFAETRQIVVK